MLLEDIRLGLVDWFHFILVGGILFVLKGSIALLSPYHFVGVIMMSMSAVASFIYLSSYGVYNFSLIFDANYFK